MTIARKNQICLDDTPYYHCTTRCVRRAFLCGRDKLTGRDLEHRRQWIKDRKSFLATVFAVDVCAYAIMSNHYHIVLRIDRDRAREWNASEVIDRWGQLFRLPSYVERYRDGGELLPPELDAVNNTIETYRSRLHDLSWFMRLMNEKVARQANEEDNCKGHFWESRFKSQALLDEKALLSCMAYVDLNPIRAGMASTIIDSDFTSVQERAKAATASKQPAGLLPFDPVEEAKGTISYTLTDYLALVDYTGRAIRNDKRGAIANDSPKLLIDLGVSIEDWLKLMEAFHQKPATLIGATKHCRNLLGRLRRRWRLNLEAYQVLYP